MGQKTHPLCFRLKKTHAYKSFWFSNFTNYGQKLEEDFIIRSYISKYLNYINLDKIKIYRQNAQLIIQIYIVKTFTLIQQAKNFSTKIKKHLFNKSIYFQTVTIQFIEILERYTSAILIAKDIAFQLEKRTPFKRVLKQSLHKTKKQSFLGIKLQISGRLNGHEIARTESLTKGSIPLQTIDAVIDYGQFYAQTMYGIVGVKVWLFSQNRFINNYK
uniref:Small ribosomal subunit protein uS3c n=1 Tax=Pterocladiophila hemisphaerica TaxID=2712948 RepID=A0A6M3WWC1_9FLOR|nr:ribosomal protein S3 [Pterocladiophila hemisphaerica]